MKDEAHPNPDAPRETCEEHTETIKRLEYENRLRRDFVANFLHDIRSALSAVRGYLETPLMKSDLPPRVRRRCLQIAHKHTVRLGALVNELFSLAMLDDVEPSSPRERFSLSELVMDTAIAFKLEADKKNIRLTFNVGAEPAFTVGNIAQIQRALENLVSNAIHFTPDGGRIAISAVPGKDSINVAVSDSGPGIPEDRLPRVFDRFYTAAPDNEVKTGSSGLGLAIVKQILELHDSSIRVSSKVGSGTRFEFELPRVDEAG